LLLIEQADSRSHMSSIEREIASQPDLWRRSAERAAGLAGALPAEGEQVAIAGCGTSLYIAQAAAALREEAGHGPTDAFPASEPRSARDYDTLLVISRSGTTTEVLRLLEQLRPKRTIAITTDPATPVAAAVDEAIALDFADEESVVQTRFATSALALLRAHLGDSLEEAATDAEAALEAQLPAQPSDVGQWVFLGSGWTVGLAAEAALKLREAAQSWTEHYPALEFRHGPISAVTDSTVVWSLGPLDDDLRDDAQATGATVVAPAFDPMASLVLAQRTAVALALERGLDPDRPQHLTRSVILSQGVTR
jgi:fructoselysine-6-P-deglycase FrlB-like protein